MPPCPLVSAIATPVRIWIANRVNNWDTTIRNSVPENGPGAHHRAARQAVTAHPNLRHATYLVRGAAHCAQHARQTSSACRVRRWRRVGWNACRHLCSANSRAPNCILSLGHRERAAESRINLL
jgi:hypothetical protein